MYWSVVLFILSFPACAAGHSFAAHTPAPLPLVIAVFAGIISLSVTFFVSKKLTRTIYAPKVICSLPQHTKMLVLIASTAITLYAVASGSFASYFWLVLWIVAPIIAATCSKLVQYLYTPSESPTQHLRNYRTQFPFSIIGLLAVIAFEFFSGYNDTPGILVLVIAWYVIFSICMSHLFENWSDRHDVFGVILRLAGVTAPYEFKVSSLTIVTQHPQIIRVSFSDFVFIAVLIVSTCFDGLVHSNLVKNIFGYDQISSVGPLALVSVFFGALILFCSLYSLMILLIQDDISLKLHRPYKDIFSVFAPICIPIAFAYLFAHNLTRITIIFLDENAIYGWTLQVLCIVAGHVWSSIYAHNIAYLYFKDASIVRVGQRALLVFMLVLTWGSLLLLQAAH
jgi:hypothetical protein